MKKRFVSLLLLAIFSLLAFSAFSSTTRRPFNVQEYETRGTYLLNNSHLAYTTSDNFFVVLDITDSANPTPISYNFFPAIPDQHFSSFDRAAQKFYFFPVDHGTEFNLVCVDVSNPSAPTISLKKIVSSPELTQETFYVNHNKLFVTGNAIVETDSGPRPQPRLYIFDLSFAEGFPVTYTTLPAHIGWSNPDVYNMSPGRCVANDNYCAFRNNFSHDVKIYAINNLEEIELPNFPEEEAFAVAESHDFLLVLTEYGLHSYRFSDNEFIHVGITQGENWEYQNLHVIGEDVYVVANNMLHPISFNGETPEFRDAIAPAPTGFANIEFGINNSTFTDEYILHDNSIYTFPSDIEVSSFIPDSDALFDFSNDYSLFGDHLYIRKAITCSVYDLFPSRAVELVGTVDYPYEKIYASNSAFICKFTEQLGIPSYRIFARDDILMETTLQTLSNMTYKGNDGGDIAAFLHGSEYKIFNLSENVTEIATIYNTTGLQSRFIGHHGGHYYFMHNDIEGEQDILLCSIDQGDETLDLVVIAYLPHINGEAKLNYPNLQHVWTEQTSETETSLCCEDYLFTSPTRLESQGISTLITTGIALPQPDFLQKEGVFCFGCDKKFYFYRNDATIDSVFCPATNINELAFSRSRVCVPGDNSFWEYRLDLETTVEDKPVAAPETMTPFLSTLYPNPFNQQTIVSFALPAAGKTNVSVYNTLGRKIAILQDGVLQQGKHTLSWNAASCASGTYFIRIETPNKTSVMRAVLLK